jgi:sugar-specific transcriptional regulator TrmB
LKEFGFSEEEAEIYVFLLATGPTPARVIARRFDVNRMRVYRTLKDLEEKGLVHRIMERPFRFVAEPIDGLLKKYIQKTKEKLLNLQINEQRIIEDLEKIQSDISTIVVEPRFRIYQGRQQVYELLAQMCDRVEKEISIVTTSSDILRFSLWGIDDKLTNLSKLGIKVRMLTQVDKTDINDVEEFSRYIDIRHIELPSPVRFVMIDGVENLTSVAMDDSMSMTTNDDTGLWTNAPSFTTIMKVFYESIWRMAPEVNVVINTLRTGKKPQEFRAIRSSTDFEQLFKTILKRNISSIDIILKGIQELPIPISKLIENTRGKNLRILTLVDENQGYAIYKLLNVAEIRHLSSESDLTLLVGDKKESLLSTSNTSSSIQAVWSNLDGFVNIMNIVFEDYWKEGKPVQDRLREIMIERNKEEIIHILMDSLISKGWKVKVPGYLSGVTGINYVFDLFVENQEKSIGINLNLSGDAFNQIFELSARKKELREFTLVLASIRPFEEEVIKLASLYEIDLIQGEDVLKLVRLILDTYN